MTLDFSDSSKLILLYANEAELCFDPVAAADNPESVAFNILLTWQMRFQAHKLQDYECWFETKALKGFESGLEKLQETRQGSVILKDMSERPVLTVSLNGNTGEIIFELADLSKQGSLKFTMQTSADEVAEMYSKLRHYPKWW